MRYRTLYTKTDAERLETIINQERLQNRVTELAGEISADYQGRRPILTVVLKGSFVFASDLIRRLDIDFIVDFIAIESYGDSLKSKGAVRLTKDLSHDIAGQDVIFVEDIVDSGLTLSYIYANFMARNPRSLEVVTLLDKAENRKTDLSIKYVGFEVPNRFVVGYGLDMGERFRGLPYLAYLKDNVEYEQHV
jgi:hypoxanthine phosphoribosyltransferase